MSLLVLERWINQFSSVVKLVCIYFKFKYLNNNNNQKYIRHPEVRRVDKWLEIVTELDLLNETSKKRWNRDDADDLRIKLLNPINIIWIYIIFVSDYKILGSVLGLGKTKKRSTRKESLQKKHRSGKL